GRDRDEQVQVQRLRHPADHVVRASEAEVQLSMSCLELAERRLVGLCVDFALGGYSPPDWWFGCPRCSDVDGWLRRRSTFVEDAVHGCAPSSTGGVASR